MPWQGQALAYIDVVPELNFASRFYARMLKQIRLYPALLSEDGHLTPIKEGEPVELLDRIQDPGGGRTQILSAYGRLMFVTGEGTLFGRRLGTEEERWSFVWNEELHIEQDSQGEVTKITHKPGGDSTEYGPEEARAYRMWTPHPRDSSEADSPMRSVLDIAEELIILTQSVRATAVTRLTSGIAFIPDEASFPSVEPEGDEDMLVDPFMAAWADHLSAQVENFGSAEARVPFIVRMASDLIERFRHEKIHDPATDYLERDLRKEAVERLALGLDMPPEVLRGLGQANHWSARQILSDMWPSHGHPVGTQFASDLNEVYLRPALRDEGYENWNRVVIGIDASQVTIMADPSDDADRAFDRLAVGWEGYRKLKNIPEAYAPDGDEFRTLLALKLRNPLLLPGEEGEASPDGRSPEEGPSLPGPEGDSGRRTRVTASSAMESGAALTALARCRELAGMRLRQKPIRSTLEQVCPDCEEKPLGVTAAALGSERLAILKLDPMKLVRGGSDHLRSALLMWGWPEGDADALCALVELHAAQTLFEMELPRLPQGFELQVERMREAAA